MRKAKKQRRIDLKMDLVGDKIETQDDVALFSLRTLGMFFLRCCMRSQRVVVVISLV